MKKLFLSIILGTLLLFSAQKVSAVSIDPVQMAIDLGGDMVGILVGSLISNTFVNTTVDWVNKGFSLTGGEEQPAYLSDPEGFFRGVAEEVTEVFRDEARSSLSSTLGSDADEIIRRIEAEGQYITGTFETRLNQGMDTSMRVSPAERAQYLNNFETGGGWETFLKQTQYCVNNPVCVENFVMNEFRAVQTNTEQRFRDEIVSSGGFLTMRECVRGGSGQADALGCTSYTNITPAGLIAEQISQASGQELEQAIQMDEITEALLGMILNQIVNSLSTTGLSGTGFFGSEDGLAGLQRGIARMLEVHAKTSNARARKAIEDAIDNVLSDACRQAEIGCGGLESIDLEMGEITDEEDEIERSMEIIEDIKDDTSDIADNTSED